MKLATSTGDFCWYVDFVHEEVEQFADGKFKYINLEQNTSREFLDDGEEWRGVCDAWGNAAQKAGVTFVASHAPCLHKPVLNDEDTYRKNVRAIRRSIENCHLLGIDRIVVHVCPHKDFTVEDFYAYNIKFIGEFLDLAEWYGITIMIENWAPKEYNFSTAKEMNDFLDRMDHPLLAACWDTAHGNINPVAREMGQYENIVALGDRLKGLHIADNFGDCHHHSWPFAGTVNFDSVMQGLLDVKYDGYFTFEASYTLLHQNNLPYRREGWEYRGQPVEKLRNPSLLLKKQAVDLLYEIGKHMLQTYGCFEE